MSALPDWFPSNHLCIWPHEDKLVEFFDPTKDRYVRMKPGRYLAQYQPQLSRAEVTALATRWAAEFAPPELKIAETREEVKRVYTEGPHSCMAYLFRGLPAHPSAIYTNEGDLRVAYIERGGKPTARAVIWPEKKRYVRIYGDKERLQPLLEAQGYIQGYLHGARVPRIECRGGFILPYVDGTPNVRAMEDHLVLGGGRVSSRRLSGYFTDKRRCKLTKQYLPGNEFSRVIQPSRRAQYWHRDHIATHAYRFNSEYYSNSVPKITMHNGEEWPAPFFASRGVTCSGNGQNYDRYECQYINGAFFSNDYLRTANAVAA